MWLNLFDKVVLALKISLLILALVVFVKPSLELNTKLKKSAFGFFLIILFVGFFFWNANYSIQQNLPAGLFGDPNALNYQGRNIETSNLTLILPEKESLQLTLVLEDKPEETSLNLLQFPRDIQISVTEKLNLVGKEEKYLNSEQRQIATPDTLSIPISSNYLIQSAYLSTLANTQKIDKSYSNTFSSPETISLQLPKNSEISSGEISLQASSGQSGITGNVISEDTTCNSCADCQNKLTNATNGITITLANDIDLESSQNPNKYSCVNWFAANRVTFDCNNHIISGINGIGMYLSSVSKGIIKNCNFQGFGTQLSLQLGSVSGTNEAEILNSEFNINSINGKAITGGSDKLTIDNIKVSNIPTSRQAMLDIGIVKQGIIKNSHFYDKRTDYLTPTIVFSGDLTTNTKIFNNYFENRATGRYPIAGGPPQGSGSTVAYNDVSCSTANIIGGPCQGGNYYNFTDSLSLTCADADSNGICDQGVTYSGASFGGYTTPITDQYPLTLLQSQVAVNQTNQTILNQTQQNTTIVNVTNFTGSKYASISLNSQLVFSTNESKSQTINISQQIKSQLSACQTELCNIKLDFHSSNMNFNGNINIKYSSQDYPQITLNKKTLLIGDKVDIKAYLNGDYNLLFESQSPVDLTVKQIEVNYLILEKTQDISEQINTYCKTYPCHIPVKISSQSGGEVLITLNKQ